MGHIFAVFFAGAHVRVNLFGLISFCHEFYQSVSLNSVAPYVAQRKENKWILAGVVNHVRFISLKQERA